MTIIRNGQPRWRDVVLSVELTPDSFTGMSAGRKETVRLGPGDTTIETWIRVEDVALWWTWDLGRPDLYRLRVAIQEADKWLDEDSMLVGVRELVKIPGGWEMYLNGVRIFFAGRYISLTNFWRSRTALDMSTMSRLCGGQHECRAGIRGRRAFRVLRSV